MIIAEIKKKENIVEYILYMRQIIDIIRGFELNIDKIDEELVSKYEVSNKDKIKIRNWYQNLIDEIKEEDIIKNGDILEIKNLLTDLNDIHLRLLADSNEYRHHELYSWAKPNIEEYKKLSKSDSNNEVEICVNAMYALFLLKLQHKNISEETSEAMQTFGALLANLADIYKNINYTSPLD